MTNTLQRKLTEVRREKALLEQRIERDTPHGSHKHPVPESEEPGSAIGENHYPTAIRNINNNNNNEDMSTASSSSMTPKRMKTTKTEPSITEDPEEEEDEGIGDDDIDNNNGTIDMMDHYMS